MYILYVLMMNKQSIFGWTDAVHDYEWQLVWY